MKLVVIECDNCGADDRCRKSKLPNGRRVDLCARCRDGKPRVNVGLPLEEWPLLVRRESVRALLTDRDRLARELAEERGVEMPGVLSERVRRTVRPLAAVAS